MTYFITTDLRVPRAILGTRGTRSCWPTLPESPPRQVLTLLEPELRQRLAIGVMHEYPLVHAQSVGDVVRAVREGPVGTVLLSPRTVTGDSQSVPDVLGRYAGLRIVLLLPEREQTGSADLLRLGARGITESIDLSATNGWTSLRNVCEDTGDRTAARILGAIEATMDDASPEMRRFFGILAYSAPSIATGRELSHMLGLNPSSLMSRFFRAGVPSPKTYLSAVRILYARALLDPPKVSISDVAHRMRFSSPQAFGRHTRSVLGLTARELRDQLTFCQLLEHFVSRLIVPCRKAFRNLDPLGNGFGTWAKGVAVNDVHLLH